MQQMKTCLMPSRRCSLSIAFLQFPLSLLPACTLCSFLLPSFVDGKADLAAPDVEELVQIALEIILHYDKELFTQVQGMVSICSRRCTPQ